MSPTETPASSGAQPNLHSQTHSSTITKTIFKRRSTFTAGGEPVLSSHQTTEDASDHGDMSFASVQTLDENTREPPPSRYKRARLHSIDVDETTPAVTDPRRIHEQEEAVVFHPDDAQRSIQTNKPHSKSFPLMKLPPEIRNEIYRACLTRPFNIHLSRDFPLSLQGKKPHEELLSETRALMMMVQPANPASNSVRAAMAYAQPAGASMSEMVEQLNAAGVWRDNNDDPTTQSSSNVLSTSYTTNNDTSTQSSTDDSSTSSTGTISYIVSPSSTSASDEPREVRPQDEDPLVINLLRASRTIYQEARSILYSENHFTLKLNTALPTLAALHQRSRRQIKYVELEIPCYNEILERFQETVRLSLRYCWGLKTFIIHMPFVLPGANGSGTTGNSTVYANGFDILRWLPRQCEVVLKGNVSAEIKAVVSRNANLARTLDELAYARRQLISNETDRG